MNTLKVISWRVLLVGTVFAVIVAGITAFRNQNQGYDYEASIAKLRRIGQALQLYRQEWGVKPVEERRTYSDAGLPPFMLNLLTSPYRPDEGFEIFRVAQPNGFSRSVGTHLYQVYVPPQIPGTVHIPADVFARRGESLPVLVDLNMNPKQDPGRLEAIVLRLDGTVEVISFGWTDAQQLNEVLIEQ
ncbi:MAG: hypothetical protein AB1725_00620 [Armatimonadota bacterium]